MGQPISRAQFLRGDFRGARASLRPPWALGEAAFIDACNRCGDCIPACGEGLLRTVRGFPAIDFGRGACTFCGACADSCKSGALKRDGRPAWNLTATISDNCLTQRGVVCRTCGEHCDASAIRFRLAPGGIAHAQLDQSVCTGCGGCVAPCPVNAITIHPKLPAEEVAA